MHRLMTTMALLTPLLLFPAVASATMFEGEEMREAAGFPALTRFIKGDPARPLVVFIPGAHHSARIAYGGHEGSRPEDFLAHHLVEAGYNFLGLSYPIRPADAVFDDAYPSFTARDWGKQAARLAKAYRTKAGLTGDVIVIGWSMAGKIVQSVAEAAEAEGLDLAFFLSFAATPPVTGAISMNRDVAMSSDGYADREESYSGWYAQIAASGQPDGGRPVIREDIYRQHYVGDIPINLQGYGLRYRDDRFVRDHWADMADYKPFDFAGMPRIATVMPSEPADARHALTDESAWGYFQTNGTYAREIAGPKRDVKALDSEQWQRLVTLIRDMPDALSVKVEGNHFFFVGEKGAKAAAEAVRTLDDDVRQFDRELEEILH